MKCIIYHISSGGVGRLGFYGVLGLMSPLSTSLCSRGCGYNIMCASVWSCMVLKPLPASTCLSPAARCWFLWFNLSLSFPLSRSLRALSHLNAPSPLLCLSQQRICDCWALTSITVGWNHHCDIQPCFPAAGLHILFIFTLTLQENYGTCKMSWFICFAVSTGL